ncbi:AlbA family DNA-binding domain-containing protein [Nesterenkonia ebinurensis]|uniref:AlbA family DNA-binding domain-containing protein n=1 Tax=Nesterenkonia ebinurensis TaxID=2608252 RepID=UPI00123D90CF|nr:ATP-binding protein [Nesterenkonia ebinurensis]
MTTFTALHRALGLPPSPITSKLLDAAVEAGVAETDDLDWKRELPQTKGLADTDLPKDIAAMANSGGGIIVYGAAERQKCAAERVNVDVFTEGQERTLRAAAYSAIVPPVMNLKIHRLDESEPRAVVIEVPPSAEGPHLILKNQYFGAPLRNDADTEWMKERQIEHAYRARFEERRHSAQALAALYDEAAVGRGEDRAWLIAAARPRMPFVGKSMDRSDASQLIQRAFSVVQNWISGQAPHPMMETSWPSPRPGLRRWTVSSDGSRRSWQDTQVGLLHDGSVLLTTSLGGAPGRSMDDLMEPHQITGSLIELGVADHMALVWSVAEHYGLDEYDVCVGIEWGGSELLEFWTSDNTNFLTGDLGTPVHRYTPVEITASPKTTVQDFHAQVYELVQLCINQGGLSRLRLMHEPAPQQ